MSRTSFRLVLVALCCLFFANPSFAQDKRLSIQQTMDYQLYPRSEIVGLQFVANSGQVAYAKDDTIFLGNPGAAKNVLTLPDINKALQSAGEQPLRNLYGFKAFSDKEFRFTVRQHCYLYNLKKRTLTKLYDIPEGENLDIEPNSFQQAYTVNNNLYINSNGKVVSIEDPNPGIVFGQPVHRHEFGIEKGTFWSPKGSYLAFYRMDETMVTDYPLVNTSSRIASTKPFKYPMAGMKSHEVTVGIYNTTTEKITYLRTRKDNSLDERENYLTNLSWSPDEKYLYIAKICRQQNHLWLERYNVETGNLDKVLFEETNPCYIDPQEGLFFVPRHPELFLWFSERDGYKHLYLYSSTGELVRQLTKGDFDVLSIISFDAKGENLFVYSNKQDPTGRYCYKINIKSGDMQLLTPEPGTHTVQVNDAGTTLVDRYSNLTTPSRTLLRNSKGKVLATLSDVTNPLAEYAMPNIELGSIKAADGVTDLYYRLITPPDMRKGQKYPTLVYVYGGPHSQLVTNSWLGGGNLYFLFLAQQGYVVFTLDNRGTDNRGFAFESCTHRHLGQIEMADQLQGVNFLQSLPYVDTSRIGVEGWSFGGFMTITMKLAHPEIFKVACAGGPVIDWKWYEVMYGERYMDTPEENPDGYASTSLISKAGDLQGRLLVIHGAEDNTVVWQNSIEFIQACIKQGKLVDYFIYPHHEHNVLGYDRIHLYHKMFQYYEDFLKK